MAEYAPRLYAASVSFLADAELYSAALAAVSPERRARTLRFRREEDRFRILAAGLLLRHALAAAGTDPAERELTRDANGKPILKSGKLCFNLSHSGEYALCAAAGYEVGCDVERVRPVDLRVAERYFSAEEQAALAAQPGQAEREALFFRFWTLRESFLKATGSGLKLPRDAFRIVYGDEVSAELTADGRRYRFAEFSDLSGYRCALCAAGECRDTVLERVDLTEDLRREK